jgi:hypothetical protein
MDSLLSTVVKLDEVVGSYIDFVHDDLHFGRMAQAR